MPYQSPYYRWMMFLLIAAGLFSTIRLPELYLSNDFKVYFSEDSPELAAYQRFEQEYANHDTLVILINKNSSWLNQESLKLLQTIRQTVERWSAVRKVHSLEQIPLYFSANDEIEQRALLDWLPDITKIRNQLSKDPQWHGLLLSDTEQVTLMIAELAQPDSIGSVEPHSPEASEVIIKKDKALFRESAEQAMRQVEIWQKQNPDLKIHLLGSVISNLTLEQAVTQDLQTLVPLSYLLITITLLIFLRTLKGVIFTLLIISLSVTFTFTFYLWFKTELTPVAGFVPSVVLTLAVADCVHYLTSYRHFYRRLLSEKPNGLIGTEKNEPQNLAAVANQNAFQVNWLPITITSFTTAVGVLMLNLSDSPPYRDLGNMVCIGVLLAWLFSLILLPWLLHHFPIHFFSARQKTSIAPNYYRLLKKHQRAIFISLLLLFGLSAYGLSRLTLSENWSRYFSSEFAIAESIDQMQQSFHRLHRYELVMSIPSEKSEDIEQQQDIHNIDFLQALDRMTQFFQEHPQVSQVQSYTLLLKNMNKIFHNQDDTYFSIPDNRSLAAQLHLLFEISSDGDNDQSVFYNFEKTSARISILLKPMTSAQLLQFETDIEHYFTEDNNSYHYELSGLDHIFSHIAERNIRSMLLGSIAALLLISILLGLVLKSLRFTLLSFIPNCFPALIAYGLWGIFAGYIDLALSVVICMSIGIVVDDTVHLLSKFSYAKNSLQLSNQQSIIYSMNIVGYALVVTTTILVIGFSVIMFSPMIPTAATGALFCITLLAALLIDLMLVPLLLRKMA